MPAKITLRPVLKMGCKVFTTSLKLFRAPHAYTSIFLTENGRHTRSVPGFVSVHTCRACNSTLRLRMLGENRLLSACTMQVCDFRYIYIYIHIDTHVWMDINGSCYPTGYILIWDLVSIHFTQHGNPDVQQPYFCLQQEECTWPEQWDTGRLCGLQWRQLQARLHHVLRFFTGIMMPVPEQEKVVFLSTKEVQQ